MYDIEILTLYEYSLRMKAFNYISVDKRHDMYQQAWINNSATSTSEKGKPTYKTFKDFFDYEKELAKVEGPKKRQVTETSKARARMASKINQ